MEEMTEKLEMSVGLFDSEMWVIPYDEVGVFGEGV
jgi:hypothetical protein